MPHFSKRESHANGRYTRLDGVCVGYELFREPPDAVSEMPRCEGASNFLCFGVKAVLNAADFLKSDTNPQKKRTQGISLFPTRCEGCSAICRGTLWEIKDKFTNDASTESE